MKLKLNTSSATAAAAAAADAATATPTVSTPRIKFTNRALSFSSAPAEAEATKTKGAKKRVREAGDEQQGSAPKKQARVDNPKKIKLQTAGLQGPQIIKLKKENGAKTPTTPSSATRVKIKAPGRPMTRPLGVGYDSEAEDAEGDPAIEENFILRMKPGPDCDYVRKAVEERKIGVPVSQGGADVHMRFFGPHARRAAVTVQGRPYAAVLVDLPCITESLKSWDKRGWWKSADICQMLLVLDIVAKEEDAREYPLPREIDSKTWQYPHGLTPPLHNVRKRRFRKRVSHRTIEAAESEVNRLLGLEDKANAEDGGIVVEELDIDDLNRMDEVDEEEDDDAEGDMDEMFSQLQQPGDEDDQDALFDQLAGQLMGGDDDEIELSLPANVADPSSDAATPAGEFVAIQSPSGEISAIELQRASSAGAQVSASGEEDAADEEEDEEDDDDDDEDDDEDEGSRERAAEMAEKRAAIRDLERQLQETRLQKQNTANPVFKARFDTRIKSLEQDLQVKKRDIGEFDDDF